MPFCHILECHNRMYVCLLGDCTEQVPNGGYKVMIASENPEIEGILQAFLLGQVSRKGVRAYSQACPKYAKVRPSTRTWGIAEIRLWFTEIHLWYAYPGVPRVPPCTSLYCPEAVSKRHVRPQTAYHGP